MRRYAPGRGFGFQASVEERLADWGLGGLLRGDSVTLYHGTTRQFDAFDPSKSRAELVDRFYGTGIFLTPSKRVAVRYAEANRNIGFDPSIIVDLTRRNPVAGALMSKLYTLGDDAWDEVSLWRTLEDAGINPNTVADVCRHTVGSAIFDNPADKDEINIFSLSTGMPDWAYDQLDELGLDSSVYRPKVYTVSATVHRPFVTSRRTPTKRVRKLGYDSMVYFGRGLVDGVPEVVVFDPSRVAILGVEVVRWVAIGRGESVQQLEPR